MQMDNPYMANVNFGEFVSFWNVTLFNRSSIITLGPKTLEVGMGDNFLHFTTIIKFNTNPKLLT